MKVGAEKALIKKKKTKRENVYFFTSNERKQTNVFQKTVEFEVYRFLFYLFDFVNIYLQISIISVIMPHF